MQDGVLTVVKAACFSTGLVLVVSSTVEGSTNYEADDDSRRYKENKSNG